MLWVRVPLPAQKFSLDSQTGNSKIGRMTTETKLPNGKLVFVDFYVMLGDGDGSMSGHQILAKSEWDDDVRMFQEHLDKNMTDAVWKEHESFGEYRVNLESYNVSPITRKEAEVLKKFVGISSGDFRFPSDFI